MSVNGLVAAPVSLPGQPHNPLSRRKIETVAVRSSAFFGLIFGLQTFPFLYAQLLLVKPGWPYLVDAAIFGGLIVAAIAVLVPALSGTVRSINAYFAIAYLLALVTWPLAVADPAQMAGQKPWLWYLCTLATATAAVAFPVWVAGVYLVVTPVVYALVHATPAGGGASWQLCVLDAVYAIILGGAVLVILTLLRQAAASVDAAQATALARYSHAVRQHATELERVQVDAIVHDSVLTTLLTAARAFTPEAKELVAKMAQNTIGQLWEAVSATPGGATVTVRDLAKRIQVAASGLPAAFEVRGRGIDGGVLPGQAAEAIFSAAMQAMVNSIQHAGSGRTVARWVSVSSNTLDSIRVVVGDTGVGFHPLEVPMERLGLRVSILERVASAGGVVDVDSAVGSGTVVTIRWPADQNAVQRGWDQTGETPIPASQDIAQHGGDMQESSSAQSPRQPGRLNTGKETG